MLLKQRREQPLFIAEYDDMPVGYVLVTTDKMRPRSQVGLVAYISGICVFPSFQRQGIGTKLMEKAIEWSKKQGVVLIENDDEIKENPGAVSFLTKLGFEIFHRGAYMSKDLKLPDRFVLPGKHEIREHRLEDIDDLLRIRKETFKEFGSWYNITNEEGFKQGMRSRIGRNDIKVFVAIKNDQPVGYVYCQIHSDNRASIRNISVLPNYRKRGVGSALMARALDFLRKNRVQRLGTVTETAESFYKNVGFKVEKRFVRVRKHN